MSSDQTAPATIDEYIAGFSADVRNMLEQVRSTWERRCQAAEKELVVENELGQVHLFTDPQLVQQILGNLIDNACKYSRGADDRRIWLRARPGGGRRGAARRTAWIRSLPGATMAADRALAVG